LRCREVESQSIGTIRSAWESKMNSLGEGDSRDQKRLIVECQN
jgi:hypothetical protein